MDAPQLQMHIAMYPWLAMGHITTYLHLANKLAKRRHRISFFIPKRTKAKVEHYNLYPHLITFIPITIPHVDGLPPQAETTFDVPLSLATLFMTAMDRTKKDIEPLLHELKPNVVFFDFALWIPSLARSLGIKSLQYITVNVMSVAFIESMKKQCQQNNLVEDDEMNLMNSPPAGFPDSSIKLHAHEVRGLASFMKLEVGGVSFMDHVCTGANLSDAVGFRGCREIEGQYAEFLESFYWKPLLLSGPGLPDPPNSTLEQKWAQWLARFNPGSVIYCAFGSECRMVQDQFKELLLGLELTGFPFLAALKAPIGFESVEEAMPEGFKERVHGRGIVHGGWVQQTLILDHPSIGCFITHCGASSLLEALVNKCQLVMLPNVLDQIFNARMMSSSFKAGVEVEKGEEDGLFTKESVCKAVKTVMDDESEVGRQVRENHLKLRNILSSKDLENTYNDSFCHKLQELLGG
ncbi:anthocyanidin 3-O-glucoside 2''-O-glucosyltransferase [Cajanus cajan]|uniref:anthocyanidin 3-O-glucoside 2''-O-glucosyltransferase n=1 Tax=Cajanus cajan TaxID=3821 RepID=UPI0010FB4C46|nr:anthocyanidin 3-O-glucoside 2''-O-glucosyltransferase [Cajanus cajan]